MNWPVPNTNLNTPDRMSRNEPTTKMVYYAVEFTNGQRQDQIMAHYSYNYRTTDLPNYDWSDKKIMLAVIQPG